MCAGVALTPFAIALAQVAGSTVLGVNALEQRDVALGWSTKRHLLGQPIYNDESERIGTSMMSSWPPTWQERTQSSGSAASWASAGTMS
jgi:hypothetical protein